MIENYAEALYSSGILGQAAAVLQRRLAADSDNVDVLAKLGEIYRKQGELEKAAEVFDRLCQLTPEDARARHLRALLHGTVPPAWSVDNNTLQPAPFVLLRNFLPPDEHAAMLPAVLAAPDEDVFQSTVGKNQYNPEMRQSYTVGGLRDLEKSFWTRVAEVLPSVLPNLWVEPFTVGSKEVRIRTYRSGGFFEVHRDNSIPESAARRVSFVYFFHRLPRRYTGGELLMIDSSPDSVNYAVTNFTKITPVDNAIIMFPSRFYHAVVPVECASDDPGDARFVVNGHIRVEVPAVQ
jgi:Rps23 Pro-64 3,4-dihydroxylase Tpa1-like proline 4-hydroxylase